MNFRALKPEDFDKLTGLFEVIRQDPTSKRFHPHPFDSAQALKLCAYSGEDLYMGAFDDQNELLAYGMLRGWDEGFATPSLGIYVAPHARGWGLARHVMHGLHSAAKRAGASQVLLKVYPDNVKAISLYKKLGYVFDENLDGQMVGRIDLRKQEV